MDVDREEKIKLALKAVEEGMPKLKASKIFGVPRATIQFRMSEKFKKPGYGPDTYLSKNEEKLLVDWILTCQRRGFPKRIEDLQKSVQNFLKECGRKTPFPNGLPGRGWYRAFTKRHPELSLRTTEAVTQASSCISESDIRWFKTIEEELISGDYRHIHLDDKRVFNGDETNFLLCPKNKKVIACRGSKNVYEIDQGIAKSALTVMFTFSANGSLTPPMIIYPYKRKPPQEILETVPSDWGVGYSDNGWMKASLFFEYITNVFNVYLERNNIEKPVILFVDGHKTHLTLQINKLCQNLGIILIALYPNATRILQPADISAFKPLKSGWQKGILNWRREHPHLQFTKENFAPLLHKVIQNYVNKQIIVNGFKATGLFPWNENTIDYSKCLGGKTEIVADNNECDSKKNDCAKPLLDYNTFKQLVGEEVIQSFESGQESINSAEKEHLFKIWKYFTDYDLGKTITNDSTLFDIENMDIDIVFNDKSSIQDISKNNTSEGASKLDISPPNVVTD
ncbi:hypothetical protein NQ314_009219 [Rhamnusium bicolor]|uniref:HTH CENPB-type domain-containing protein n=1 Tax=Rhamnusium bicolor TaxID=1586634 RepID=A0AAV8Y245_9CUCU|nr:hypothetical protein NQ314_009219 [Rhamnusium bicolor]